MNPETLNAESVRLTAAIREGERAGLPRKRLAGMLQRLIEVRRALCRCAVEPETT